MIETSRQERRQTGATRSWFPRTVNHIKMLVVAGLSLGIKTLAHMKITSLSNKAFLVSIPLLFSIGVSALFYPGFMTYDTLHALRSARNGGTDSMWPPMVSYVWRAVDLVSSNPSAMHFLQVFILLFSIFVVVFIFTKKIRYATGFLIFYLSIPVVLGTVAVIWKDVLMAAFFMAGFLVIVSTRFVANKYWFVLLTFLALILIIERVNF